MRRTDVRFLMISDRAKLDRLRASGKLRRDSFEYKGLTASGAETPWTGSGGLCGSRGRSIPLIGFAVRQKSAPGGALVDCEYTGYFQFGAVAGPARNGAPCRSAIENGPLEGIQLRITPRQATPAPPKPAPAPTA
jgi:hypothetical protein